MNIKQAKALIAAEFTEFMGFRATPDDATLSHLALGLRAGLITLDGVRAEFARMAKHSAEMAEIKGNRI